jgi:hypothetical protein
VFEARHELDLAQESLAVDGVHREVVGDDLHRDLAVVEPAVGREVDLAHVAGVQRVEVEDVAWQEPRQLLVGGERRGGVVHLAGYLRWRVAWGHCMPNTVETGSPRSKDNETK